MKMKLLVLALLMLPLGVIKASAENDYVGSDQCFSCHQEIYSQWLATGHPWKLRKVDKARYAKIPLPPGYSWDDITYVIGGAIKKARFIDKEGYIVTAAKDGSEAKTQYNLEDGSWSFYHKGEKKPYACGPCHMTNYSKEGNQDNMEGMVGTWSEDGIGCEECHGPGMNHVREPSKETIKIDTSSEACGKCHQRGGMGPEPPAKGGFIRHHEQINELKAGVHKDMGCVDCHNPHQRAILVKDNCLECHEEIGKSYAMTIHGKQGTRCVECHMPKATKSAISVASYTGDVRTHLFKINTAADANMFKEVEDNGKKSTFAQGFVTVEYSCLSCHGGRDKEWASKNAMNYHDQK
ncbi:multiheme c-type cytochrome [Desulfosediminicola ganghwensis]|uniref:multiheme c-type cytochrome n=1 Tax=Desulfosediminicola ganghwensis TaxID=2569540 RepID=UPI0010AC3019|nr:multiheme c-type cytochrome [Desulfosediminicola ganghwensis]